MRISYRAGRGFAGTSGEGETTCPGVQKPHWTASVRTNAWTRGWSRSPSIVVTSRSPTVWTSVMQESAATPSSCTVQAPQCPSPQATFVPVRPRSSRNTCPSDRPTGASYSYVPPLMRSSGRRRHRHDVREVDEAEGCACVSDAIPFVSVFRKREPHRLCSREQLPDLIELLPVPVCAVVAGVEGQAEHADSVRLPRPEEWRRHREVLVDAGERHGLLEGLDALRRGRRERRLAVGDSVGVAGQQR